MRALRKEKDKIAVSVVSRPAIQSATDVLIHIQVAALCRTDVFAAEGRIACKETLVLGHEFAGFVVETGAAVKNCSRGDRVAVMPVMPCRACDLCKEGREISCQNTSMLGIDCDGAFAEYIVVPASAVYKLPENLSFRHGAYAEPVAAALSVIKSGIRPGEKGMIYGNNRFGQLIQRILTAYEFDNIHIYDPASGIIPENAYDFVVETMATEQAMKDIFKSVRPGGRVVIKSRRHEPVGINFALAVKKEITLSAVNYGDFDEALRLMATGLLQVDDLMGNIHALEDYADVFERSKTHETLKTFFDPAKAA